MGSVLEDVQQKPWAGQCDRCGENLNGYEIEPDEWGHVYCPSCLEENDHARLEERWLQARKSGIGASEASCILGLNPWKTNVQLWEEKTGRRKAEDIGNKPPVIYGKKAEAYIRGLFSLDFPCYFVDYDEFGMVAQPERPWLFATLDGVLTEAVTGRHGVLEIKTTEIMRAGDWSKWDGKVPDYYYTQILHQLLATDFDFAILRAQIKWHKDGELQISTRHYKFERAELRDDLDYLMNEETRFWDCVQKDRRPSLILPQI